MLFKSLFASLVMMMVTIDYGNEDSDDDDDDDDVDDDDDLTSLSHGERGERLLQFEPLSLLPMMPLSRTFPC